MLPPHPFTELVFALSGRNINGYRKKQRNNLPLTASNYTGRKFKKTLSIFISAELFRTPKVFLRVRVWAYVPISAEGRAPPSTCVAPRHPWRLEIAR